MSALFLEMAVAVTDVRVDAPLIDKPDRAFAAVCDVYQSAI